MFRTKGHDKNVHNLVVGGEAQARPTHRLYLGQFYCIQMNDGKDFFETVYLQFPL